MNVTQHHPMDVIELAPEPFMLPLNDALTEEQYREIQTEQERKVGGRVFSDSRRGLRHKHLKPCEARALKDYACFLLILVEAVGVGGWGGRVEDVMPKIPVGGPKGPFNPPILGPLQRNGYQSALFFKFPIHLPTYGTQKVY